MILNLWFKNRFHLKSYRSRKYLEINLEKGIINKSQFDNFNVEHIKTGISFKDLVLKAGLATEEDLVKIQSELTGTPFIDLSDLSERIPEGIISQIPENLARKHIILPFASKDNRLSVAMSDPEDLDLIQFLERSTKKGIDVFIGVPAHILKTIEREYGREGPGKDVTEAIELAAANTTQKLKESLNSIEQADEIIKVSPVAQIVSVILEYAVSELM